MTRQIIIDCDPGIDDAMALLLALSARDKLSLLGVTAVAGNKPVKRTEANARRVLALVHGSGVPVFGGCSNSLMTRTAPDYDYHGTDGLADIGLPDPGPPQETRHAVDFIIESVLAAPPKSITLCALGPLTNLALAFVKEPRLPGLLAQVGIMGGSYPAQEQDGGNAEFNFRSDPCAAQIVLGSGASIRLFGLNVTRQSKLDDSFLAALSRSAGKAAQAAVQWAHYLKERGRCLHDPCVLADLLEPTIFGGEAGNLEVEWRDRTQAGTCRFNADAQGKVTLIRRVDSGAYLRLLADGILSLVEAERR
jgi:purine nucleosidase